MIREYWQPFDKSLPIAKVANALRQCFTRGLQIPSDTQQRVFKRLQITSENVTNSPELQRPFAEGCPIHIQRDNLSDMPLKNVKFKL
jgi:hypothetical protein